MITSVRTRFAPSPTGFIHLGNIRSALYSWAFARKHQGTFILRIEDTDLKRSTEAATQAIFDGMKWLGIDFDEGPYYQMRRIDRYREVVKQMLHQGLAYRCYMSTEQLDALRMQQRAAGLKPRYDGTWRPKPGQLLSTPPAGVQPVIRFNNPLTGTVVWDDAVKGRIEISNHELDDLIIARSDGTPTYNFCVVVDDLDMEITHVIRGDDHLNNTPRQINILRALGGTPPIYGHLPTVLNEQGEKLSKRNGAMSVSWYRDEGYLPEAILNYLARLGWAHGDAEIFSREQFVEWFDLEHLGKSPARHDDSKLKWLNKYYLKKTDNSRLAALVLPMLITLNVNSTQEVPLDGVVSLLKDRSNTVREIARDAVIFYQAPAPSAQEIQQYLTDSVRLALAKFIEALSEIPWTKTAISEVLGVVLRAYTLKLPQLAMPVRLLAVGAKHTPSIDAVLYLLGRETVLKRLRVALS
ncbi:glutamate--tRNA ligase [Candidatus Vallotia tarda]|uniref:Glutamate--tRNA ligase n=1 Tax=Candidatus Vallotiella hemipterorum TaxID=1177213 RepID=A0A916JTX0_9BURK|nr:glutamate--tRNA ligase [Candidatus Vallotia tarda]CAG7602919.1 Glutamate--tRNA ligase [Candidatus Vallotia tarda]